MGKFSEALQRAAYPYKAMARKTTKSDEDLAQKDVSSFLDLLMSVSQPFRTGANVLAQGYGPMVRGLTGGDPMTPGPVESFIRQGVTPDEQSYIDRKPYMAAIKSGVGIGSTMLPFAQRAAPAAQLGARTAQLAGRGALEGLAGGLGYSREGSEVQDTLLGGALGVGGELLGNYALDPSYRGMVNKGWDSLADGGPGKYSGALRLNDGTMLDDNLENLRREAFQSANISDAPSEMTNLTRNRPLDSLQDDIELLSNATNTQQGRQYLEALNSQYGDELGGAIQMPLRLYDAVDEGIDPLLIEARKYKTVDEFTKKWDEVARHGEGAFDIGPAGNKASKISPEEDAFRQMVYDYVGDPKVDALYDKGWTDADILKDAWNKANQVDNVADPLLAEARNYKSAEEFVKAQGDPLHEFKTMKTIEDLDIARGSVEEAIEDIGGIDNVKRGFMDIDDIKTTENVNMNSARAAAVREEVEGGTITPLVLEDGGDGLYIMDGHHRFNIYRDLGLKDIPVIAPKHSSIKSLTKSQLTDIWNKAQGILKK